MSHGIVYLRVHSKPPETAEGPVRIRESRSPSPPAHLKLTRFARAQAQHFRVKRTCWRPLKSMPYTYSPPDSPIASACALMRIDMDQEEAARARRELEALSLDDFATAQERRGSGKKRIMFENAETGMKYCRRVSRSEDEDDLSQSSRCSSTKKRKHVHFQPEADQLHLFEGSPREEARSLWYRSDEVRFFKQSARHVCRQVNVEDVLRVAYTDAGLEGINGSNVDLVCTLGVSSTPTCIHYFVSHFSLFVFALGEPSNFAIGRSA